MTAQTQTAHIVALYFGLVPEQYKEKTVQGLLRLLKKENDHLVTGFVGTPYFCHALSQNGHVKEAYDLLLKDDFPSWLYQVKMGATTVWEHWDGLKPDGTMWSADKNSFNHYAYGSIGEWLVRVMAGLEVERRFEIPGNTVEFVRDLRYNKYRVFTELQNEQKKKGCGRMIDIAHAKQEFEKYLDEYDREDEQICLKIVHTYGVVKYAGEIARKMECSDEDVELAELIGLLHDIGRFEQIRRFHSFEPGTMDHAVFGAELLFGEEKLIRRFVEDDKYDEMIDAAIRKHSDFKLEGIHDARTLFHAKLIRDADKLDNCRVKLEASVEAMLGVSEKAAGEGLISPAVWESCLRRESVLSADRHVPVDYWVSYLAQYYDINFPETCEIIEEEDYITRIAGRLTYQEQDTRTKIHILTEDLNRYLEMPAVSVKE